MLNKTRLTNAYKNTIDKQKKTETETILAKIIELHSANNQMKTVKRYKKQERYAVPMCTSTSTQGEIIASHQRK